MPEAVNERDIATTCGRTTSSRTGRTTFGCSTSSTSSRTRARRSGPAQAIDVIDVLSDLFILRGVPGHVRSDNGAEFVAEGGAGVDRRRRRKTAYIAPGSPWENGYIESFNARLSELLERRDLLLAAGSADRHQRRRHYNAIRPHASSATGRRHLSCSCPSCPHGRLKGYGRHRRWGVRCLGRSEVINPAQTCD